MMILLTVLYGLTLLALVVVMGVRPQLSHHSRFELRRRVKAGDKEAEYLLRRNPLMHDIFSLQRVLTAVLLVILSAIGVELFHWAFGLIVTLGIALEIGAVSRLAVLQNASQKLYERYEPRLLSLIEKHPVVFKMIRTVSPIPPDVYDIESREELLHMVEQSGGILTADEKKMIENGLKFDGRAVEEIMVARSRMQTLPASEVLGPLVLDDLYKTGYSRFPVTGESIDDIIGIVYLHDIMQVGAHASTLTAREAMSKKVYYIRSDQSLRHALSAFIRSRHHLFIVINDARETIGLITMEDCIEALLGRKIVDEFDDHDSKASVAQRKPRNNAAKSGVTL